MSQENAKKCMELMKTDEDLQKRVKDAMDAYTGDKTDAKTVFDTVLAPISKEIGYECSWEDVEALVKLSGNEELSEDEVSMVAGGKGGGMCMVIGAGTDNPFKYCYGVGIGAGLWTVD